ncbi:MAG TPA: sugar phosphate isomerase/epimerase family protein [Lacipirellulaceae bacterium]|nr:sugar phosphate isomerase/epimerase family protein [Lacipirellulaceae bacterium]
MPRLAAGPKAYVDALCVDGSMRLREWIEIGAELRLDGLEFYTRFLELQRPGEPEAGRRCAAEHGLEIPMLCASPDFTHPDTEFRQRQIDEQKRANDLCAALGGRYCGVLSGQRRAVLSRDDGLRYAAEGIEACLPHAATCGVTLVLENHYKDDYWTHREFVQKGDDFCELVQRIDSPYFGVNFDPSNALLAGEEPLELLRRVKDRVVTMHASDRYVAEGTLDDLRRQESSAGYARRLRHGVLGRGLNDYDAIFGELAGVGFDGWISVEDGVIGIDELRESVRFLRHMIAVHWPARQ